jgi:hypothetical protein
MAEVSGVGISKNKAAAPAHVFMIHLWLEPIEGERGEWRGKIQHIQSGEVEYFRGLENLTAVIEAGLQHKVDSRKSGR